MENPKQENAVQIGNTTFYVTSVFSGTVQLEYLIKRLIQKEIEQENNTWKILNRRMQSKLGIQRFM